MADDELTTLAADLGLALTANGSRLALAESCTGGMAAQVVTAIAGSSAWFECGFVTYSNAAKVAMLGVLPHTLELFGAVSEPVAVEMAHGALTRSHAQIAAAITGVAGPAGGTPEKPVGMVCFAWVATTGEEMSATLHFAGDRAAVRRQSVGHALRETVRLLRRPPGATTAV